MSNEVVSYRDLRAWQRAMDLADLTYTITECFPRLEHFGLTSQMRKAAVSVPSNIAEGTRHRRPGYINRIIIALGEHAELETQMLLAARRGYVRTTALQEFEALSAEVGRLTHGLLRSLESQNQIANP
jgi:four helix bundle protein